MIHYQKPIILMRPGAPNDRLAERLAKLGMNVWKWPAFTILPPEEPERVKERLSDLTKFDMVLLASPSAVAASAVYVKKWPEHITLAIPPCFIPRVKRLSPVLSDFLNF